MVTAIVMLNWNGFDFIASDSDVVDVAVAVAEHQLDVPKIAVFLRRYSVPLDYGDEPV